MYPAARTRTCVRGKQERNLIKAELFRRQLTSGLASLLGRGRLELHHAALPLRPNHGLTATAWARIRRDRIWRVTSKPLHIASDESTPDLFVVATAPPVVSAALQDFSPAIPVASGRHPPRRPKSLASIGYREAAGYS